MRRWIIGSACLLGTATVVVVLLPWTLPRALAWSRPDVLFRGVPNRKQLFLTIDDAPSDSTPAIIAVLQKHHVPATFFVIGNRVHSDEQLTRIVGAGYTLGHHMRTTERCSKMPLEKFYSDFDFTDHLLRRFAAPGYFRPPSDLGTIEQIAYVRSKGYEPVLGTVFPLDHWIRHPSILALLVRWLAIPGGIIIMHDGDQRGKTTAQVLDEVLPILKNAGYEFEALGSRERLAVKELPENVFLCL